jgi:hypothetical protein
MDFDEVEAIRRQGYFHEVIGDIQKNSYRDIKNHNTTELVSVDKSGIVTLSPHRRGTRPIIGNHMSRQYKLVDDNRASSNRSLYYLSEDGSYTDFNNSSVDNTRQYNKVMNNNQYYEYNNPNVNAPVTSSASRLFQSVNENNNTNSYDDVRQSKASHQSDEESQLSAYLNWLEAQHMSDDNNDNDNDNINRNPKQQQTRSFDDIDIPRHPRDLAMKNESAVTMQRS